MLNLTAGWAIPAEHLRRTHCWGTGRAQGACGTGLSSGTDARPAAPGARTGSELGLLLLPASRRRAWSVGAPQSLKTGHGLLTGLPGSPPVSCTLQQLAGRPGPQQKQHVRDHPDTASLHLAAHDDGPKLAMVSNKHNLLGAHDERDEALSLSCLGALIQQHLPLHAW